jgi:hypothetical protein
VTTGANLYFTVSGLTSSGLIFLSQQVIDFRLFLASTTVIVFGLFILGVILASNIVGTALLKAKYTYALNLIRRYFVDNDQAIVHYLVLPFTVSPIDTMENQEGKNIRVNITWILLIPVYIWISVLLGFIVGAAIWLLELQLSLELIFGITSVISVSCFIILSFLAKRRITKRKKAIIEVQRSQQALILGEKRPN